jgi:hypothetical protein
VRTTAELSIRRTSLLLLLLTSISASGLVTGSARAEDAEKPAAESGKADPGEDKPKEPSDVDKKRIQTLKDFFTKIYTRPLKNRNWFVRAMAVTLLSRLETPEITDKLMEILQKDAHPMVRMYAWEALHARNPVLSDEQRKTWVAEGIELSRRNTFKGDLRADLLASATEFGPEGLDGNVAKYYYDLLGKVRHDNPYDSRTLQRMRETVKAWNDPEIARRTAIMMTRPHVGYVAEFVLGGLNHSIEPLGRVDRQVSPNAWRTAQEKWALWAKKANLTPTPVEKLPKYRELSRYLPAARKLTDPDDRTWREDLELGKLQITHFDLVFCLDMTGGVASTAMMEWVASNADRILEALKVLSRAPRIGVVYYCHEVVDKAMQPCCREAMAKARKTGNYDEVMKLFKLTPNTAVLARRMAQFDETGGHGPRDKVAVGWGAIYSGLWVALKKQPWSRTSGAQKIIVCFGDEQLTEGTHEMTKQLVSEAGREGFVISFVEIYRKRRKKNLDVVYSELADLANGSCFVLQVDKDDDRKSSSPSLFNGQIAAPPEKGSVYTTVVGQIVSSIVPKSYRKHVQPFVTVLMENVDASLAERR